MANLAASKAFDLSTLDFSLFLTAQSGSVGSSSSAGIDLAGRRFDAVKGYQFGDGGFTRIAYFGGTAEIDDSFSGLAAGTVSGFVLADSTTDVAFADLDLRFALRDFAVEATKFSSAISTVGTADDQALFGSILSGKDNIILSNADDTISGYGGNDTISGRAGNDTLGGGRGNDTILGGAGIDALRGNAGNDKLNGGSGHDTLTGGAGADRFIFSIGSQVVEANSDIIRDFSSQQGDKIALTLPASLTSIFTTVLNPDGRTYGIASGNFYAASGAVAARDADDRLVYDTKTGNLYYDDDGTGAHEAVLLAQLGTGSTHPALAVVDIIIL